jgi:hypothetical protein
MSYARLEKMQRVPEQKRTIAAHGFLNLLLKLRRVLLQDCAFLQERHPDNLLLKHDIFQSDAYKAYAEQVIQRSKSVKAPMDVQFQQVMPHLHTKMDTISGVLEMGVKDIQSSLDQNLCNLRGELQPTLSKIGAVQEGQALHQQLIGKSLNLLAQSLQLVTEGTFETRLRMPDESTATTSGGGDRQAGRDLVSMLGQANRFESECLRFRIGIRCPTHVAAGHDIRNGSQPYDGRHALEGVDGWCVWPSFGRGDVEEGSEEVGRSAQALLKAEDCSGRGQTVGGHAH